MSKTTKVQASAPAKKKKSIETKAVSLPVFKNPPPPPSHLKAQDPRAISKRLNRESTHFIIYNSNGGYRFALFCRIDKADPFEMMAESPKAYKLKSECIKVMKKIMYCIGDLMTRSWIAAFDHKGQKISLSIDYNIKKLL